MNPADANLLVKFYKEAVHMKHASEKAGHPVYEDRDFISIIIPGDTTTKIEREASDQDKERWLPIWEKYQRNESQEIDGWPIESWVLSPARVNELKHFGFHTVEQLANASDAQINKVMEGMGMREKARAAIEVSKDSGAIAKYVEENERLKADIEDLKAQFAEMKNKGRKAA